VVVGIRPTAVFKENDELTKGPSEVSDRWLQHFKKRFMMKECWMPSPPHHLCYILMIDPLTMAKLEDAMSRLKTRKAGGLSGILPEMVHGGPVLLERLLVLM